MFESKYLRVQMFAFSKINRIFAPALGLQTVARKFWYY